MKMKKIFSACALLLALTAVGCNAGESSAASQSTNKPATSQPSTNKPSTGAPASTTSAAPSTTSSAAPAVEYPTVLPRTWTEGAKANNSDGKEYVHLSDATANKVGVKIKIIDFNSDSTASFDSNGKLPNGSNNADKVLKYSVVAPKAGKYQLLVKAKFSAGQYALNNSNGDSDTRGIFVTLNGEDVDIMGSRNGEDCGMNDSTFEYFVLAPELNLRGPGQEDTFTFGNPYYRLVFDLESDVICSEI